MGIVPRRSDVFVLRVNPILCDGFGHCHELAPELVALDEWGYPMIRPEATSVVDEAHQSAIYAVRGCPRSALRIERRSATPPATR
jgi:ferredoxin